MAAYISPFAVPFTESKRVTVGPALVPPVFKPWKMTTSPLPSSRLVQKGAWQFGEPVKTKYNENYTVVIPLAIGDKRAVLHLMDLRNKSEKPHSFKYFENNVEKALAVDNPHVVHVLDYALNLGVEENGHILTEHVYVTELPQDNFFSLLRLGVFDEVLTRTYGKQLMQDC